MNRSQSAGAAVAVFGLLLSCAPAYDVQTLYDKLQSTDFEERQDAQETIDKIIQAGDYKVFARGAESPVKAHRAPSIIFLSRMKQPEAKAAFRDLLRVERRMMIPYNPIRMKAVSEETDSRILVAHLILENGGDPQALPVLIENQDGQPPDVLSATCFAVGALRDPGGVAFLKKAAAERDVEVIRAAVQALGMFRVPEALEALRPLATHPSEEVRSEVLSALQFQEGPAVVPILETMAASDPAPQIRAAAMGQLGRFKEPSPVPFLIEQLKRNDETTRQAALDTLRLLSGQPYGLRPDQWTRWWQQNEKGLAARP